MNDDGEVLLRAAEAVADGQPVDWEHHTATHPSLMRQLGHLRLIESIGAAHRQERSQAEPTVPAPSLGEDAAPAGRWGPLQLLERIGKGGMGEVFRAHDPTLQRDVALKLFHPHEADPSRFLNEARRLARVRHPNVLAVHGADRYDGRVGLWTDLVHGMTLEQSLQIQGPLGAEEAGRVGVDLCRALAAVHGAGLIHGDVKTANVMREEGGRIVLMDFSAVKERGDLDAMHQSGTPAYMAPELFRGDKATRASDVYSLGVLLYRLVTKRFPVEASTMQELCARHERGERVPLRDRRPDLPGAFVQAVERAIDPDAAARYATVGELERALTRGLGAPGVERGPRPRRRLRAWPAAAALALVALAVAGALLIPALLKPFEVQVDLFRFTNGLEERLLPGAKIRPGDALFLEIEGNKPINVYVVNGDEQGEAWVLFPLPDLPLHNPLPAGRRHRLPGTDGEEVNDWRVSSAGGRETILVIASRQPLEALERRLAALPRAERSATPFRLEGGGAELLRGIGELQPRRPSAAGGREELSRIAEQLSQHAGRGSGVRVWSIELDNPGS